MFELIGLVFATLLLFLIALIAGCIFAFVAWLMVRGRRCRRWAMVLIALAIPVLSAGYLWICTAVLPGESLFGDISERLPNGYTFEGLGKMPDFANIVKGEGGGGQTPLPECIGSLQVFGALVVGKYSHPFGQFAPEAEEHYFIFNTQTGQHVDFKTQSALETNLGHPVQLVAGQFFRSSEPSAIRQRRTNNIIIFGPPALSALLYLVWMAFLPRDDSIPSSIVELGLR